jgi:hypothetical protein
MRRYKPFCTDLKIATKKVVESRFFERLLVFKLFDAIVERLLVFNPSAGNRLHPS